MLIYYYCGNQCIILLSNKLFKDKLILKYLCKPNFCCLHYNFKFKYLKMFIKYLKMSIKYRKMSIKYLKMSIKSHLLQLIKCNLDFYILGEELLTPTIIYVQSVISLMRNNLVKGFAHITGGGLAENVPRILPEGTAVTLDANSWKVHAVFGWLAHKVQETMFALYMHKLHAFNLPITVVIINEQKVIKKVIDFF